MATRLAIRGKPACDLDSDYSGMQEQRHENKWWIDWH